MQPTVQVDSDSWLAIESPEFAVRFGRLLGATRRHSRRSVDELAAVSSLRFDASELKQFERGSTTVDESIVEGLCLLYSADIGRVLPARLPVAIAGGRLVGAGVSVEFSPGDPTSLMIAYLRLIRRMRNQRKAPAIALRRDDILTLARYLDIDGADVVDRLSSLMNVSASQRNTMAMLFATGAIVIGLAAGGHAAAESALDVDSDTASGHQLAVAETQLDLAFDRVSVVVDDAAPVDDGPPVTTTAPDRAPVTAPSTVAAAPGAPGPERASIATSTTPTTIDEPVSAPPVVRNVVLEVPPTAPTASVIVIDEAADVAGLSTATRVQAPAAAPPLTTAAESPTANQSGCNPDPSDAVMSLTIPDIGYSCPVYTGGQSTIDAGFVTLVTDAGANPVLATRPGEPGTLWLAGHRSTHGAAFAQVPDLADGALVTVGSGGDTATYRVVGRSYVEVRDGRVIDASGQATAEATWASIIRDDFSGNLAPRLVLQTCEGEHFRWMIYADLVT